MIKPKVTLSLFLYLRTHSLQHHICFSWGPIPTGWSLHVVGIPEYKFEKRRLTNFDPLSTALQASPKYAVSSDDNLNCSLFGSTSPIPKDEEIIVFRF